MAKTYCMKCGHENVHDITQKPASCGRCKSGLQILGPMKLDDKAFAEAISQIKGPNPLNKFKVQPISDEELGLTEGNTYNLRELWAEGVAKANKKDVERGLPLEETLDSSEE